ncbi:fructoselysine 6-kinase [Brassicibacter mesophilus]|uniref:fructoselysine 6-kinase n=1 Tax=Brassicibacter mesophilus TaxID=745119 RepID=UPI003D22FDC5
MRFIAIGDNCIDIYEHTGKAFPGGNSVNFSVYVKQLGEDSSYLGIVGNDYYGDIMIKEINSKGVDVSYLHRVYGRTAITKVKLTDGDRILGAYYEGVFKNFKLSEDDLKYIKKHDFLHTAIWGKCEEYLNELKERLVISFDFADKINWTKFEDICPNIHYAFLSYNKDDEFIRDILKKIKRLGPKCVVATLGHNGSIAYDGMEFYKEGIKQVEVVDSLGAGDSFIAGFMVGIARGRDIKTCLSMGTNKASKTITYFGAW